MASLNGYVGHHGRCHCRYHCPLVGRHKPGGSHYYPARLKPDNYDVEGCNHEDIDLDKLLRGFKDGGTEGYFQDLRRILQASGITNYEKIRLETGICKPSIFLGLHPDHTLPIPGLFSGDSMHLASLNLPDLFLGAWRATLSCDRTDRKSDWAWAIFAKKEVWEAHGKAVASMTPYIPGSFDRPPRNPAEKMHSGYKAWEFLLYIFGLGPALLYQLLPRTYWENFCKLVRAIRILLQVEITTEEVQEAHDLLLEFSDQYEDLYVQRRCDRLHFVRSSIHTPSHLPAETIRIGPSAIGSQWTMERMIGSLVSEIRLHSNPYANLAQRGIRRCQINALKAMIPDIVDEAKAEPQGSQTIGDGYVLLARSELKASSVTESEANAIKRYLFQLDPSIDASRYFKVKRWARLRLPNGQIARSRWKEDVMRAGRLRTARNVKGSHYELAEVHYYVYVKFKGNAVALALASFYGPPDPDVYKASSKTYISVEHFRDLDVRAIDVKSIDSVVMMAPDSRYILGLPEGTVYKGNDRYFMMEKPGLKICSLIGELEHDKHEYYA